MFRLATQDFDITEAALVPYVSDDGKELSWSLEVVARGSGERADWEPGVTCDRIVTTPVGAIRRWRDVAPARGSWAAPVPPAEALLYVFEHEVVRDCTWELRVEESVVSAVLTAVADVRYEEGPFWKNVAVHIDTPVQLGPWLCGRRTEAECLEMYRRTGLEDEVAFESIRGVSQLRLRT